MAALSLALRRFAARAGADRSVVSPLFGNVGKVERRGRVGWERRSVDGILVVVGVRPGDGQRVGGRERIEEDGEGGLADVSAIAVKIRCELYLYYSRF